MYEYDKSSVYFSAEIIKAFFTDISINELILNTGSTDFCRLVKNECHTEGYLCSLLEDSVFSNNRQSLNERIAYYLDMLCEVSNKELRNLTVYDVLYFFTQNMVYYINDQFRYRYEFTDVWINITKELSQDLIISTAVIQDSEKKNINDLPTDWNYCISSDNIELQKMLNRSSGTSENHFHLRGSTPYFEVAWVYLMNTPNNPKYEIKLSEIDNNNLKRKKIYSKQEPLALLLKKAAAIRLYLYSLIFDKTYYWSDGIISLIDYQNDCKEFELDYKEFYNEKVTLKAIKHYYMKSIKSYAKYKKYCSIAMYNWVIKVLNSNQLHNMLLWDQLQDGITYHNVMLGTIDYAQNNKKINQKYYNSQGERTLLNMCLKKIYNMSLECEQIQSLLYIYLNIKYLFFNEMVQNNGRNGFFNFSEYQDRKDFFLPWSYSLERKLTFDTICSIIDDVKINHVELRITPQIEPQDNIDSIKNYDIAINEAIECCKKYSKHPLEISCKNFYYVFHFIKIADSNHAENVCRNSISRKISLLQSDSIVKMRYYSIDVSKRVLGIDACAEEIDCRPEVFGSVFRKLQYYNKTDNNLPQLKVTYHVGEDNYDILDSLRAISEAVIFLSLQPGSRLGHATYLGVDASEYYKLNGNVVSLPIQVWIDNVVWLYNFIQENDIQFEGKVSCLDFLENEFNNHFFELYNEFLTDTYLGTKLQKKDASYYPKSVSECKFDMMVYFYSWLLRGDEPSLYFDNYYPKEIFNANSFLICKSDIRMTKARKKFESCYLYWLYHYNKTIKEKGDKSIIVNLPPCFINAIVASQFRLREFISHKSILIESNPTSNLKISTIEKYTQHPISTFYSNGLKKDSYNKQINVSINTDDKSIFSTNLSNEYTYLLFYLEQEKNDDGSSKYSRFELLNWLNEIREIGNEQSFAYE